MTVGFEHDRRNPSLVKKLASELELLSPALQQLFLQDPISFVQSNDVPPEVKALLDSQVPMTVEARVGDGRVVLTGDADWLYQREEAERVAGNVQGVREVVNEILVTDSRELGKDVEHEIRKTFLTTARLDAEHLDVAVANGTITLTGRVQSRLEHDEAVAAAWAIPGVRIVDDRLTVTS